MANSPSITGAHPKPQLRPGLACRLRPKEVVGIRGPLKGMGELELENVSPEVIEIPYQMSPLQYLDLVVIGPSSTPVSEGHFGDRFSPEQEAQVLRLRPGEKFTENVPLLGTVPLAQQVPGTYQVQAVYEFDGIRAVSDPVEVKVC